MQVLCSGQGDEQLEREMQGASQVGPWLKLLCFQCVWRGLIPGRGPKIPHALQCSKIFFKMSAPESGLGTHLKAPCSYTSCSLLTLG